jgi:hypothetical protein
MDGRNLVSQGLVIGLRWDQYGWLRRCPTQVVQTIANSISGGITMDLERAVKQAEQKLMSKPNVNGVGIGERDGKPVIKVFVTRKVPKSELRDNEIIPSEIAGHQIDVEELGVVSVQSSQK